MIPVRIAGANVRYVAEGCLDLMVRRDVYADGTVTLSSAWQLSADELKRLCEGESVIVSIYATQLPPVAVSVGQARRSDLLRAVSAVLAFDWSDNDDDAVAAIARLRAAVEAQP